jgi:hypothetical protein
MNTMAHRLFVAAIANAFALLAACGSNSGSGAGSGGNSGIVISGSGSGGGGVRGVLPGQECAAESLEGEFLPIDMFVMMDQSISMGDSEAIYLIPGGGIKWDAVRAGFASFVADPAVAGVGMGIAFFGQGSGNTRCDPATYAQAEVPIALLPPVGQQILATYDQHAPGDDTPLTPALQGAISYARQWKTSHPGRNGVVTLVTDGFPHDNCGSTLANLESAAAAGLAGTPPVQTFVIGIAGQELSLAEFEQAMRATATAGGTEAVLVYANTDMATEFTRALNAVRAAAQLPCTLAIPPETGRGPVDFSRVNVVLRPVSGDPVPIFNVPNADGCGSEQGWYYDNPAAPSTFVLCPATCAVASSAAAAGIEIVLGCKTATLVQ